MLYSCRFCANIPIHHVQMFTHAPVHMFSRSQIPTDDVVDDFITGCHRAQSKSSSQAKHVKIEMTTDLGSVVLISASGLILDLELHVVELLEGLVSSDTDCQVIIIDIDLSAYDYTYHKSKGCLRRCLLHKIIRNHVLFRNIYI